MIDTTKFKEMCRMGHTRFAWVLFVALVLVLGWGLLGGAFQVDRSSYQAVFLTSGQVYFGKLKMGVGDFIILKDAHYLQVAPTGQSTGVVPPISLNIISLENQPHSPQEKVYISKNQVLFWENLKPDSQAIKIINEQRVAQQ